MRKISLRVFIVLVVVFYSAFPLKANSQNYPIELNGDIFRLENAFLDVVRRAYVDSIDNVELYRGALDGMIKKLDPHSSFMPEKEAGEFTEKIRGNFQGIGITFAILDDKITIIDAIQGGPSEKAGLTSRDKIVKIGGKNVIGIDEDQVKDRLRGDAGTKVDVHIERPGEKKLLKFTIIRDRVKLNSVSHSYMIDDTTGYIALKSFTINARNDVGKALAKLKAMGMGRLLLDLRGNSGGSLEAAVGIVDFFINNGVVVYTKGRRTGDNNTWRASDLGSKQSYSDIPMIVMINHGSASASEIVAGALQDHDRAFIVGQTSFGKGLVMNPFPLFNKRTKKNFGTLMLSVAHYYTPSDRLIQRTYKNGREEYIREGLDDIDPNAADSSKTGKPVFYTDLGREVFGGGGITPDITFNQTRKLNSLERSLRATHVFFEFADDYLLRHDDIPKYFDEFLFSYRIPDDELERFKQFAIEYDDRIKESKPPFRNEIEKLLEKYEVSDKSIDVIVEGMREEGINIDETFFQKSAHFIEREIKQEIARMIWSSEARYRIWHTDDTELINSLSYFEEASELLARRLAIGDM